jgi:hypothetical protein
VEGSGLWGRLGRSRGLDCGADPLEISAKDATCLFEELWLLRLLFGSKARFSRLAHRFNNLAYHDMMLMFLQYYRFWIERKKASEATISNGPLN